MKLRHNILSSCEEATFSLSFHTTPLSSPFFTLPPTAPTEEKVVWPVERGDEAMGGLRSVVVRLWIQVLEDMPYFAKQRIWEFVEFFSNVVLSSRT